MPAHGHPGALPPPRAPRRMRGLVALVGALVLVPVAAVLAVVTLLPDAGGDDTTATPLAVAEPDPATLSSTPALSTPVTPQDGSATGRDLQEVDAARAAALMDGAGTPVDGEVDLAWTWTDRNGLNLLAGTRSPDGAGSVTLRVVHLADLDDQGRELRTMRDPLRCDDGVEAGFLDGSVSVRDLDADGVADPVIGWWAVCGHGVDPAQVKVAVLSDGRKFILRGTGYVADARAGGSPGDVGEVPASQFEPDPARGSWPPGFYAAASSVFGELVG